MSVRLPVGFAIATLALLLSTLGLTATGSRVALLTGTVSDVNGVSIAGAEVFLPGLGKAAATNDSGWYSIAEVPPGRHEIRARRIGFLEWADHVDVPSAGNVRRNVTLRPIQTLAPVEVTADAGLRDFEEHRRIGLGKFLTRAELEKQEHRRFGEIVEAIGARSARLGNRAYVGAGRGGVLSLGLSMGQRNSCPFLEGSLMSDRSRNDSRKNPGCTMCFAQIYLDDVPIYRGGEDEVVPDMNMIIPTSVEAVEYYKSPSQTPLKYSRLNSQCGVLVVHTRRTPESTKKP